MPTPTPPAEAPPPTLGKGGRTHPVLGLGLWAMGRWDPASEERTRATLGRALELGIGWLDTAEVYGSGRSERLLGAVLAERRPAPSPLLVSKLSWEHLRPAQVRPALLGSLQRLGRERLELYLVHAPDPHVPIAETMAALEPLVEEGKVDALGVSNFTVEQLEEARMALRRADIVVNQVRFNLFEREEGDALADYCRKNGIVLEAYSPLAQGFLAGRFLDGVPPPRGDPRAGHGPFAHDRFPAFVERAQRLSALARDHDLPLEALALHWIVRKGFCPLFGASSPGQVDQAWAAWNARPSAALLDEAEAIAGGDAR